ncbi:MAG: alanine racemase [Acidobacteria bacterium]|nr:alanine racemase [Acidobacteriota bacterium]
MDNHTDIENVTKNNRDDPSPQIGRPTWAEIDLQALKDNCRKLCSLHSPSASESALNAPAKWPRIIPVVKADGYGHGAVQVTRTLADAGVKMFSVGIVEEGVALRQAGIFQDILVLSTTWQGQESLALEHRLILATDSGENIDRLDIAAGSKAVSAPVHIKVDTGMGRLGIRWDSLKSLLNSLKQSKHISLQGVFSHLSSADERDPAYTLEQKRRFERALAEFHEAGMNPGEIHFANSAGLLYHETFRQWGSRTGIALYGYAPDRDRSPVKLRPVLSLKTKVGPVRQINAGESIGYTRLFTASRDTRYATLPIGYADGFSRKLSGKCRVIIRDGWAEVIGMVSMDMIAVDLTDRPDVQQGDEVILLGTSTNCSVTADVWAETAGTIPYEILCGIASRVPRIYK